MSLGKVVVWMNVPGGVSRVDQRLVSVVDGMHGIRGKVGNFVRVIAWRV